jgi:hypothetical protein
MFKSKAGKSFGSAYVAKRHDDEADKKAQVAMGGGSNKPVMSPEHEAAETPEFEKGEQEGAKEVNPEQNEKPEQVVAKHGPATTIHVTHDRKANKHHVVSTHADGHVHTSDHASADEAHKAAGALSGGDQAAPEAEPNPAMGGETAAPMSLPKLA